MSRPPHCGVFVVQWSGHADDSRSHKLDQVDQTDQYRLGLSLFELAHPKTHGKCLHQFHDQSLTPTFYHSSSLTVVHGQHDTITKNDTVLHGQHDTITKI